MADAVAVILAYVVGSLPTGVIIGRLAGINVQRAGSGNIGATNVTRVAGTTAGLLTLIGDVGKGVLAVSLARAFGSSAFAAQIAAVSGFLGHLFSVFLRFSGGKGVATGFGVCLALAPTVMILPIALFAAVFAATRIVSVASLAAAATTPVAMGLLDAGRSNVIVATILAVLIVVRHHDNIRRLRAGVEPRFGLRRAPPADES